MRFDNQATRSYTLSVGPSFKKTKPVNAVNIGINRNLSVSASWSDHSSINIEFHTFFAVADQISPESFRANKMYFDIYRQLNVWM